MIKRAMRAAALAAAVLSMAAVGACGGDDDGGGSGGETRTGGPITLSQTSQPDFLDPALAYTVNAIEPLWLVYTRPSPTPGRRATPVRS